MRTTQPRSAFGAPASKGQRGFTLVELMVGLAVGMLLVAGLALMFANASRSSSELDKSVRHIESGRQAVDLLTQDLGMAGFFGTVPVGTTSAVTSPCLSSAALAGELQVKQAAVQPTLPFGVQGMTPTEAAANAGTAGCMPNYLAGTGAIVMRRLDTTTTPVGSVSPGTLYLQSSHYTDDNYSSYKASTSSSAFDLKDMLGATNPVRRFVSRIYYLASCNECASGGDGIPTLKMSELSGNTFVNSALAEGIEQVGFDYGFDTDGDGTPDEWYGLNGSAGNVESIAAATKGWGNAVAVRVSLVSRTTEPSSGYNDTRSYALGLQGANAVTYSPTGAAQQFKRRAYVTTVRLNSVAGSREKP